MKFKEYFEQNLLSEWKDFYLNFDLLRRLLKTFEVKYKLLIKYKNSSDSQRNSLITLENYSLEEPLNEIGYEDEKQLQENFENQLILELKKVEYFLLENLKYYKTRLDKIKDQLNYIKRNKHFKSFKENLETAIKELYKEINLMKDFIELNLKANIKILKKFKKYTKYCKVKVDVLSSVDEYIKNSLLFEPLKLISEQQSEIEKVFYTNFFYKYSFQALKKLKEYTSTIYFTHAQSFYFGFFVGILIILSLLCIIIAAYYDIDMDDDAEFKTIFPMFRGFLILCIYFWLLGLNVYAWNKANVNYKLCFQFKNHYSDVISIFKRAAFFSTVLVCMILCYMIIKTKIEQISDLIDIIPLKVTPLICWLTLLIYTFLPKDVFNFAGRKYLLWLFVESMASIMIKCEFKHVWLIDQLTSMIGPIRDIEYTMCYYTHYFHDYEERKINCNNKRSIILFIGVFPHIIRIIQCIRIIIDSKQLYPTIFNTLKYTLAIFVAITSFFPRFNEIWWLIALMSTIISYIWDVKKDFGFLEQGENYPLRQKLSYKNRYFYYFCLIINLFLRFLWVLSVSPTIVYQFIRPEFFLLFIYSGEVLRRGMWNFIRVEYQHIELCKVFKVTIDVELPFKKNEQGEYVLRTTNALIPKISKRIEKLKSTGINTVYPSANNLVDLENLNINKNKTKSFKEYESIEYRKKFQSYIKQFQENTANNLKEKDINN